MNIDKYDFYGNYSEPTDYSFSVYEIHKKQKEKESRRLQIYKTILGRCFKRIKLAVENEEKFCFFQMPEYIAGTPLYNMTECLLFILQELTSKGFQSKYCENLLIYITWPQKEKSLKLEYKKSENKLSRLEEEMNLKYRSINDYKPSGNFLYNKNKPSGNFL